MAQYTVNFSCGHTEIKHLVGKEVDRRQKITWLEREGLCSVCYKEKQDEELRMKEQEMELPDLIGSEKQIAWARKLRIESIKEAELNIKSTTWYRRGGHKETKEHLLAKILQSGRTEAEFERLWDDVKPHREEYENLVDHLDKLKTQTSAQWFIDNRY